MSRHFDTAPKSVQKNRKTILGGRDSVRTAIVQVSNPYLDRAQTIERACAAIHEAGSHGAELIVFPESWLAGYPYWSPGWNSDLPTFREACVRWHDAAIMVGSEDTERLGAAAQAAGAYVAIGCNEMDPRPESDQIYNSVVLLAPDGSVVGTHRKLMPTAQEKMFWGNGDARDLRVFETDIGRIGVLICGEHSMTPVKAALIAQREDFHIAVFHGSFHLGKGPTLVEDDPDQSAFIGVPLSRSHAIESGAFVPMACTWLCPSDIPDDFPYRKGDADFRNFNHSNGGSTIFNPLGAPLAPPLLGQPGIVYADCPAWMRKVRAAILDTFGHYGRPDLVQVLVRDSTQGDWRRAGPSLAGLEDALKRASEAFDVDETSVLAAAREFRVR
jgi:nitrilase